MSTSDQTLSRPLTFHASADFDHLMEVARAQL